MKTNNEGIKLIKDFESLHDGDLTLIGLQPKMDPIGIWTEGYGRAMRDKKGNFIKFIVKNIYKIRSIDIQLLFKIQILILRSNSFSLDGIFKFKRYFILFS